MVNSILWIVLTLGVAVSCKPKPDPLTEQYGSELQLAYESYRQAQIIAVETGDTTVLQKAATGHALESTERGILDEDAESLVEWSKIEVISLQVREYHTNTAEIFVSARILGDVENAPTAWPLICSLQQEDNVWKVSYCYPPRDDW